MIADRSTNPVFDAKGWWTASEHPGQLLTAAAAFLVAASAALLHFDGSHPGVNGPDHRMSDVVFFLHIHQRLSGAVSSKGRNLPATASRARKMRERTVPIGQFMTPAISS